MSLKKVTRKANIPKWQICTEGITEANYISEYIKRLGIESHVVINCRKASEKGCGRQHEALLDKMQECGRNLIRERTFLVHDYDRAVEHSKAKDSFNKTFGRAKDESDYYVIYSNPCVEYWFLLHTSYSDSDYHRSVCQEKVKNICNKKREEAGLSRLHEDDYKSEPMLFEYIGGLEGVCIACRNAKTRFDREDKSGSAVGPFSTIHHASQRPCTNLFELLQALDEFAERIHEKGK